MIEFWLQAACRCLAWTVERDIGDDRCHHGPDKSLGINGRIDHAILDSLIQLAGDDLCPGLYV